MQDATLMTAIDVGTTKVCTIVGSKAGPNGLNILAHSVVPSEGIRKGNVADIASTADAIRASVEDAQRVAGIKIRSAYVGVTGAHVSFANLRYEMEASSLGVITADDLDKIPDQVVSPRAGKGRQVLHAIPMHYSLDGQHGIRDPIGMHTSHLEVETHVVTAGSSYIDKLVEAVESAGIKVEDLVLEPLASSRAVLTPQERERGVALVDIGGGTTDLAMFKRGSLCFTSVIPVGGYQFTNDIRVSYDTPYKAAEDTKLKHAHTQPGVVRSHEEVTLPRNGRTTQQQVLVRDICQLTRERAQELIHLIRLKLREADVEDISSLDLVITGGTSNLPGLEDLMRQSLTNTVRIGVPEGHGSIPDALKKPAYATGVGILMWAVNQGSAAGRQTGNGTLSKLSEVRVGLISRLFKQVKNSFQSRIFAVR